MKKIFTLIAVAMMALGVNAQKTISLAGLQYSDFSYEEGKYTESTWTDADDPAITAPAFTVNGDGKYHALTLTDKGVSFNYKNSSTKDKFFILCADYFTVGGKGVQLILSDLKAGNKVVLNVAAKADNSAPAFGASNAKLVGEMPSMTAKNEFADIEYEVLADGNVTISETAKGFNIASIIIEDGSIDPAAPIETIVCADGWTLGGTPEGNEAVYTDGTKLVLTGNAEKTYAAGKAITIDGSAYTAIKLSNGAQNTLTIPEGRVATKVVFYSYVNKTSTDAGETQSFWKEVAGVEYDVKEGAENPATVMETFTDTPDYLKNPDVISFNLPNVKSFTFTNKGVQTCVVIAITMYNEEYAPTSGIQTVKANTQNGAIFNLAGQKVADGFKGLVIKNGKKMMVK